MDIKLEEIFRLLEELMDERKINSFIVCVEGEGNYHQGHAGHHSDKIFMCEMMKHRIMLHFERQLERGHREIDPKTMQEM